MRHSGTSGVISLCDFAVLVFFNVNNQLQTLAHTQEIRVAGVRGWGVVVVVGGGGRGAPLFIKDANKYLVNAACGPAAPWLI